MTKVKICGLMEHEHVKAAVEAGADAIGFVFAPSSRKVTVEQAQELARDIPDNVLKVGVFVNETQEENTRGFSKRFRSIMCNFMEMKTRVLFARCSCLRLKRYR